ncbi:hypothetical protein [Lentzea flava]|uniref:hypothetical protein n=1 Tax=Lentzea flava TaxID=103732 RepID=UPI00167071C4|nr:hypothetical protein [Lentzea flava]
MTNLVEAAKTLESHVAGSLDSVHGWISGALEKENEAFLSGDDHGPGGRYLFDQVGTEFRITAEFMKRLAADNSETVRLAAGALREIAQRYREADGQA